MARPPTADRAEGIREAEEPALFRLVAELSIYAFPNVAPWCLRVQYLRRELRRILQQPRPRVAASLTKPRHFLWLIRRGVANQPHQARAAQLGHQARARPRAPRLSHCADAGLGLRPYTQGHRAGGDLIPGLLQRLGERNLVQWGAASLAGAWLLLQVLALLSDADDWPALVLVLFDW